MSAGEPVINASETTVSDERPTMSAEEPTTKTGEPGEETPTQMLDSSRSQPSSASQSAPVGEARARANVRDGLAVKLQKLRAFYGDVAQVKGIDLDFNANEVTAIIGPSGCGKSTMVRCINHARGDPG